MSKHGEIIIPWTNITTGIWYKIVIDPLSAGTKTDKKYWEYNAHAQGFEGAQFKIRIPDDTFSRALQRYRNTPHEWDYKNTNKREILFKKVSVNSMFIESMTILGGEDDERN